MLRELAQNDRVIGRHDVKMFRTCHPPVLIKLANLNLRVNILPFRPGAGGYYIAVAPCFIVSVAPDLARLIRAARDVNDSKPEW